MAKMKKKFRPVPLPHRPMDGHKGTFGRVLVVGGNKTMLGAAVLAGTSALRSGSGLVQVAVHETLLAAALSVTPELVGFAIEDATAKEAKMTISRLLECAAEADAVVMGPGMGNSQTALEILTGLISMPMPKVLDADAINLLAQHPKLVQTMQGPAVLTPHPGEMARLAGALGLGPVSADPQARMDMAAAAARAIGAVVLLKGHGTVVSDGQQIYVNETGDNSLAKAGTGDVLAGMIGSFLGQGSSAFEAAVMGAWIHGKAGEYAGKTLGARHVLARDVIDQFQAAFTAYGRVFGVSKGGGGS